MPLVIYLTIWILVVFTIRSSGLPNLALHKPAFQSSTAYGGLAGLGNDNNTDSDFWEGFCSHTGKELVPWWTVDLRGEFSIQSLVIYNRGGRTCGGVGRCADRLVGFRVHISDSVDESDPETRFQKLCHVDDRSRLPVIIDVSCASPIIGRYVTISLNLPNIGYLTLCEVQIYGTAVTTPGTIPTTTGEVNTSQIDGLTTTGNLLWNSWAVNTDTTTNYQLSTVSAQPVVGSLPTGQTNRGTSESIQHPTTVNDRYKSTDGFISTSVRSVFVSDSPGVVIESSFVDQVITTSTTFDGVRQTSTADRVSTVSMARSMCCCSSKPSRVVVDNFMESVLNDLTINADNVTKSRRRYISVHDDRPSVVALGTSFVAVVMSLLGIIVCDITKVLHDLKGVNVHQENT